MPPEHGRLVREPGASLRSPGCPSRGPRETDRPSRVVWSLDPGRLLGRAGWSAARSWCCRLGAGGREKLWRRPETLADPHQEPGAEPARSLGPRARALHSVAMQFVGRRCEHCGVTVNVALDAAACERCATVVHWRCSPAVGGYRERVDSARCATCGDTLRWESRDDEPRVAAPAPTDAFWSLATLALFMAVLGGAALREAVPGASPIQVVGFALATGVATLLVGFAVTRTRAPARR